MKFNRKGFFYSLAATVIAIAAFNVTLNAQLPVTINGTATSVKTNGSFSISAEVSGSTNFPMQFVYYRNDVLYKTVSVNDDEDSITEMNLGHDTYTYRVRVYDSQGAWGDSTNFRVTVETPRVFKMGVGLTWSIASATPTPTPPATLGPDRNADHTDEIKAALEYLDLLGGGTLYFPCTGGPGNDPQSIYNISDTITIPDNVTIQGESSESEIGRCRIYWRDVEYNPPTPTPYPSPSPTATPPDCHDNPTNFLEKPMFKIAGNTSRVRFKDLWLYSRSSGPNCFPRYDWERIEVENTVAIAMYGNEGDISDVIFDNVSIIGFTYGIKATTCTNPDEVDTIDPESEENSRSLVPCEEETDYKIKDIKMRGYRPTGNYRQLYINAKYAYNWDIQNINPTYMMENQGAVKIDSAGAPTLLPGEYGGIKFLQLNCNGNEARTTDFCVAVKKHGGLYFKQLHHEGTNRSIVVEDIYPKTNEEPIIFEHSVATGEFHDASMKLYLIANGVFAAPKVPAPNLDQGRLKFIGSGVNSTLFDCGDLHHDITDINGGTAYWEDLQMLFSHSERNRESFFAQDSSGEFLKSHTPCHTKINETGGEHFNTGVMPMETYLPYSNILDFSGNCTDASTCAIALQNLLDHPTNRGTIYIDGSIPIDQTIIIPSGRQIVGGPESELILTDPVECDIIACNPADRLLQIDVPVATWYLPRTSGITIRNLTLRKDQKDNIATGLAIIGGDNGLPGVSSDMHFSGLTIENFDKGLEVARFAETEPARGHPMVDGLSWKDISFVGNSISARIFSSNLSNWNVMNLSMESKVSNALGWYQTNSGTSMQNVSCMGITKTMTDCIKLEMAGVYLTGFKKTQNVLNAVTFAENLPYFPMPYQARVFSNSVLRNNDFSSDIPHMSQLNIIGKAFLTSMNNKYEYFNVVTGADEGNYSRITFCNDDSDGENLFDGISEEHPNNYVGVPTPTLIECGVNPKPWEDVVNWGGEEKDVPNTFWEDDIPLTGNFYDDVKEDIVIYREKTSSEFRIKESGGTGTIITQLGTVEDIPLIGRFHPNQRAQVMVWTPSTGNWMMKDPNTSASYSGNWGLNGDVPFVGNFFDESDPNLPNPVSGNMDEIAIYRPSNQTIWIQNPRSGDYVGFSRGADYGSIIQVGDFWGLGYDQIAQFKMVSGVGVWSLFDPKIFTTASINFGEPDDIPVAGKYLSGSCTQLGVWRSISQQFIIMNPFSACGSQTPVNMRWGSNNDLASSTAADDKPLTIKTDDGLLDRPVAYRPTRGVFPKSIANGQWWIHDPF